MKALFDTAPIKKTYGMELTYDGEGRATFEMPYNPTLDHFMGGIHGGVLATLLDNAGWFTAAVYYDTWIATSDLNVKILRPAAKTSLIAAGRMLRAGKKLAMAEMEIRTEDGTLVAVGSGSFSVTTVPTWNP
jgi:uncharacterized protein (TIGR00369 family)